MNSTEINRQIVQDGLDRRAAERRDAELEAQARTLRLIINYNHTVKTSSTEATTTTEHPHSNPNAPEISEYRPIEKRTDRRADDPREARECITWYRLMIRIFAPLLVVAATVSASASGSCPFWLMIAISIAGFTLSIATFTIWCIYHRNEFGDLWKFRNAEFDKD